MANHVVESRPPRQENDLSAKALGALVATILVLALVMWIRSIWSTIPAWIWVVCVVGVSIALIILLVRLVIALLDRAGEAHLKWTQAHAQIKDARTRELEVQSQARAHDVKLAEIEQKNRESERDWQIKMAQIQQSYRIRMEELKQIPFTTQAYLDATGQFQMLPAVQVEMERSLSVGRAKMIAEQAQSPESQATIPGMCYLSEVLREHTPAINNIFLAYLAERDAASELDSLCHVAIAGSTGNGKSSLVRQLLALLVCDAVGAYVLLMNPHYTSFDPKTGEDNTPIEARLWKPPLIKYAEIAYWMKQIATVELPKRLDRFNHSRYPGTPIFVTIDELPAIVAQISDFPTWMAAILREGRKANIFLIVSSQDFLVKTLGLDGKGGAVRDCFRTAVYVGGDPTTARLLLDVKGTLEGEDQLGKGVAMIRSSTVKTASFARLPWTDNEALYSLLGPSRFTAQQRRQLVEDYRRGTVIASDATIATEDTSSRQSSHKQASTVPEDTREDAQEGSGRTDEVDYTFELKKLLREAGRLRKQGVSTDAILRQLGLSAGGRNNQDMQAVLDVIEQAEGQG